MFQVDGNSIKYHLDQQDLEVEINCVVPFGRYKLSHLDLSEFRAVGKVQPGQVLFFYGRQTRHGTYMEAVRGVRNSINTFTVQNLAKLAHIGKRDKDVQSSAAYKVLAQMAIARSILQLQDAAIWRAFKLAGC